MHEVSSLPIRGAPDVSGYVRRTRRLADLSQRDLAAATGLTQAQIARIETGGSVDVNTFARILAAAGLRFAVVDAAGVEVEEMPQDVLRDRAGRRQPAHLDVHAIPEPRTTKQLFRQADPYPRPVWHHRRAERDRQRRESGSGPANEQLTFTALANRASARREARRAAPALVPRREGG